MAKYQVEIDDKLALKWSQHWESPVEVTEIDPARVDRALAELVERYSAFPRTAGKREEAALAICRNIALERAAQFGGRESIDYTTRTILDTMLGRD